jgi:hypothetical protein
MDIGTLTSFGSDRTWFDTNGKASSIHEFVNLGSTGGIIIVQYINTVIIKLLLDAGTNQCTSRMIVGRIINIRQDKDNINCCRL